MEGEVGPVLIVAEDIRGTVAEDGTHALTPRAPGEDIDLHQVEESGKPQAHVEDGEALEAGGGPGEAAMVMPQGAWGGGF